MARNSSVISIASTIIGTRRRTVEFECNSIEHDEQVVDEWETRMESMKKSEMTELFTWQAKRTEIICDARGMPPMECTSDFADGTHTWIDVETACLLLDSTGQTYMSSSVRHLPKPSTSSSLDHSTPTSSLTGLHARDIGLVNCRRQRTGHSARLLEK